MSFDDHDERLEARMARMKRERRRGLAVTRLSPAPGGAAQ
jgi:hypothetical protein